MPRRRRRRYWPLYTTVAFTAILTALSCFYLVGWYRNAHPTPTSSRCTGVVLRAGAVEINDYVSTMQFEVGAPLNRWNSRPTLYPTYEHTTPAGGLSIRTVRIPFWTLAAPLIFWQYRRANRIIPQPGHCPSCDYDITSLTTSQCPECGAKIPA